MIVIIIYQELKILSTISVPLKPEPELENVITELTPKSSF